MKSVERAQLKNLGLLLCLALACSSLMWSTQPAAGLPAGDVMATKQDSLVYDANSNGQADLGDRLQYTLVINNATAVTDLILDDTLDSYTSLYGAVDSTPLAQPDAYETIGNTAVAMNDANGVLSGNYSTYGPDFDPDGGAVSVVAEITSSANGGFVNLRAAGGFTYVPPVGFTGVDTFPYQIEDDEGNRDSSIVTVTVSDRFWFVDPTLPTNGNGRSDAPFNTLEAAEAAADRNGDVIFLLSGSDSSCNTLQLLADQKLIGQDYDSQATLEATLGRTIPLGSQIPPPAAAPEIDCSSGGIQLATNNSLLGFTLDESGNQYAINGDTFGTLTTARVSVIGQGGLLWLRNGNLAGSLTTLAADGGPSGALYLNEVSAPAGFSVGQVTITNRPGSGLYLDQIGGSFTFNNLTITNSSNAGGYGVYIANATGSVTLNSLNVSDTNQVNAPSDGDSNGDPESLGNGDALFLVANSGTITVNGGTLSNLAADGVDIRNNPGDVVLTNLTIDGIGRDSTTPETIDDSGIFVANLTGELTISETTIKNFGKLGISSREHGIYIINSYGAPVINLDHVEIFNDNTSNVHGGVGVRLIAAGPSKVAATLDDLRTSEISRGPGLAVLVTDEAELDISVLGSRFEDGVNSSSSADGGGTAFFRAEENADLELYFFENRLEAVGYNAFSGGYNTFGMLHIDANDNSEVTALIKNNRLRTSLFSGIYLAADDDVTVFDFTLDNNEIDDLSGSGIYTYVTEEALYGQTANLVIQNNQIGLGEGIAKLPTFEPVTIDFSPTEPSGSGPQQTLNAVIANNQLKVDSDNDEAVEIYLRTSEDNRINLYAFDNTLTNSVGSDVFRLSLFSDAEGCFNLVNNLGAGVGETIYRLEEQDSSILKASGSGAGTYTQTMLEAAQASASPANQAVFNGDATNSEIYTFAGTPCAMAVEITDPFDPSAFNPNSLAGSTGALFIRDGEMAKPLPHSRAAAPQPLEAQATAPTELIDFVFGDLPPGKTITVTYVVDIATSIPTTVTELSSQGQLTYDGGSQVLTDDPDTGASSDPTVTPLVNISGRQISIEDGSADEGESGTVRVLLDYTYHLPIDIDYTTAVGSASAADFTPQSGTLTMPANIDSVDLTLEILEDTLFEATESFSVILSNPSYGSLADDTAVVTIHDDDDPPEIQAADLIVNESVGNAELVVTLNTTSGLATRFDYATEERSASAGSDFTAVSGSATIPAGSTQVTLNIPILPDVLVETAEEFRVTFSNPDNGSLDQSAVDITIVDDDVPLVSIQDSKKVEGDSGISYILFEVSLNQTVTQPVTITYQTLDGSAFSGGEADFIPENQSVTIAAGQTATNISVGIYGDTQGEGNERFYVQLLAAEEAVISDDMAVGTILNDDPVSVYLPMVLNRTTPPAPDLVVDAVTVTANNVQIVLRNAGDAPVDTNFWVDAYLNPSPPPTAVNQPWQTLSPEGLVWAIFAANDPLQPGETLTLNVGGPHFQITYSSWAGLITPGVPVYVQLDTYTLPTPVGNVAEGHELYGGSYNNISGPHFVSGGVEANDSALAPLQAAGGERPLAP